MKAIKLNKLLERFGGGGHPKAASATVRLNELGEAASVLQGLVDELVDTSLQEQLTVGDFVPAPALYLSPDMNEKQVENLFTRYDMRALPVVDADNNVIGLVTHKEVASAKVSLIDDNAIACLLSFCASNTYFSHPISNGNGKRSKSVSAEKKRLKNAESSSRRTKRKQFRIAEVPALQ